MATRLPLPTGSDSGEEPPCSGDDELQGLRQHRAWADRRIAALVRRVGEAEAPAREEAARLSLEAQVLRVSVLVGGLHAACGWWW